MAKTIGVLIVDDSPFMRLAVQRMLEPLSDVAVVGTAANGREAVEQAVRLRPDVVILDLVMPEMDGLAAIRGIMSEAPTPIVVLSSHAHPDAEVTLRALELGAVDFVSKSDASTRMDIYDLAPVLQEKVRMAARSQVPHALDQPRAPATASNPAAAGTARTGTAGSAPAAPSTMARTFDLLLLGASTGGPRALASILAALPASFPAGVVVAQHMPPGFTATLAERLDRRSGLRVREAVDGDPIRPGLALLGVGGRQIRVERQGGRLVVRIPETVGRLLHRPSVDLLFASAAEVAGSRCIAVVLTGMGDDGARGLEAVSRAGGRTLVESEETAVIYGMPKAAAEFAERELPLERIPEAILELMRSTGGG